MFRQINTRFFLFKSIPAKQVLIILLLLSTGKTFHYQQNTLKIRIFQAAVLEFVDDRSFISSLFLRHGPAHIHVSMC